jgi:peptidoglycan glycosyltransferase
MKQPIARLFGLIVVLFAVLVGFTSYWSVFDAKALRDNPNNRRGLLQEERIKRGVIRSADGKLLAGSVRGAGKTYSRRYPTGPLFGHPVGYAYTSIGRSGLEKQYNDQLTGRRTELVSVFDSLLNKHPGGDDLETTLDSKAQKVALAALKGSPSGKGAVVAMDVHTGAVKVLASSPPYDPNGLDNPRTFQRLATDNANAPLVDRATQGLYPPGSTFKTVTAAAALDTGRYSPSSMISGKNNKVISGVPLQNFSGENFGLMTLTDALTHSVNTVFGEVGEKLGGATMRKYMRRFGFETQPPIDLPADERASSGERLNSKILPATSRKVDVGRMAIGQDKLLVTPLQMAEVAQTIGNGGVRMKPYLVAKAFDPDGRTVVDTKPQQEATVMSSSAAAQLTDMMKQVVKEGTGTAAALTGVDVAGKTGTAELNNNGLNDLWFIAFTGKSAIAVLVEHVQGGQGGTVAAPIAKQVLEALGG